jgi:hypothetical protein
LLPSTLLFPVVLAIHNIDEYSHYEDFVRAYRLPIARKLATRPVVRNAATPLTLTVGVLDALTYVDKSSALMKVSKMAISAIVLNGIGHCILSVKRRTLAPGALSAVVLVLPYSALSIVVMRTSSGDSFFSLIAMQRLAHLLRRSRSCRFSG